MSLSFAQQFLVTALSAMLAIFLLLGILVLVKVNQILSETRKLIARAESIADKAEHVTDFFKNAAGPMAVTKVISNIVSAVRKHKSED